MILPKPNQKDLEELPQSISDQITFVLAEEMDTVLNHALTLSPTPIKIRQDVAASHNDTPIYRGEPRGGRYERP